MGREFDRFMVMVELASNPKIARLDDAEFRCLVSGVWPLAAKGRPRGALRVHDLPAEPADIAHQARKPVNVARRTLEKMRKLGMLEFDEALGCEVVHDWREVNPGPKASDLPAATSKRKRDQRERDKGVTSRPRHADVTRDPSREVEVEVEEQNPPTPFQGEREGGDLLGLVKARLSESMPEHTFAGWVDPVVAQSFDGSTLVVVAWERSGWVRTKFAPLLSETATEIHGSPVEVVVAETEDERSERVRQEASELRKDRRAAKVVAEAQTGGAA